MINRRSFLKAAAPLALGLRTIARGQVLIERGQFNDDDVPLARARLLDQVNGERVQANVPMLELDELACKVASEHALDMVKGDFLSHWGRDGRKPYHRYSFAGGIAAVQENVSSADNIQSLTSASVLKDLHDMHLSMVAEVPPNDGHRRTILFPQHTHVGFGVAMQGHYLRLDELYIARYVEVDPVPRLTKTKAIVPLSGKLLSRKHVLVGIDVFYEPLPSAPAIDWLRQPRSYGMPHDPVKLLPKLPDGYFYPDGGNGNIETDNGRFKARVPLSKKPGINTIQIWLRAGQNRTAFPASQICIRVK